MSQKCNPIDHPLVKKEPFGVNDVCLLNIKEELTNVQDVSSIETKIEPAEEDVCLARIKKEPTEGSTIYLSERQNEPGDKVKNEPNDFYEDCLPDTGNTEPIEIESVVLPVTFAENQPSENSKLKKSHSSVQKQSTSGTSPSWKYVCDICNKSFLQKSNLNYHYSTHSGEKNHKCETCSKGFIRKYGLLRHMTTHIGEKTHTTYNTHRCDICNKYFTAERNLKYHMRSRHTATRHRCHICHKSFTLEYLEVHMLRHTEKRPYVCKICKKEFAVPSRLREHMTTHVDGKCHRCNICNSNYTSKCNLRSHMITHIAETLKLSKDVSNKSQNKTTEEYSHSNNDNKEDIPNWCNICNKGFAEISKLKRHRIVHTGEKPYECDICNKTFGLKSSLKIHLTVHSGEKPHRCNICKKHLRSKRNLNYHMMTHNPAASLPAMLQTSDASKALL